MATAIPSVWYHGRSMAWVRSNCKFAGLTGGPRLALELLCGASDAPRDHPGFYEPGDDLIHPLHARVKEWAEANGIRNYIAGNMQGGTCYSDAYLYFEPSRLMEVADALKRIGIQGDILDIKGKLSPEEEELVRVVSGGEGWRVGGA